MYKKIFGISLLIFSAYSSADSFSGDVVGVTDGDTLTVLIADHSRYVVRLVEIDAPEKNQPFGNKSKIILSDLTFQKNVHVDVEGVDKYQRTLGRVFVDDLDVNREMIARGAAWVYRKYMKDQSLLGVESEAQSVKAGLWSLPESEQVAPWEWRKSGSSAPLLNLVDEEQNQEFQCKSKRTCGQMVSCEEARFYLKVCGIKSLDRDRDGIPCESLCG